MPKPYDYAHLSQSSILLEILGLFPEHFPVVLRILFVEGLHNGVGCVVYGGRRVHHIYYGLG